MGRLLRDAPQLLSQAREALQQGQGAAAAALLHRLRGQVANLSVLELTRGLGEAESRARQGDLPLDAWEPLVQGFEALQHNWNEAGLRRPESRKLRPRAWRLSSPNRCRNGPST